jgi:mono/diheme cytochrome c family protein
MKTQRTKVSGILLMMVAGLAGWGGYLRAQAVPAEVVKPSASQPAGRAYSAVELKGRALFIENCSYCHLARNENPKNPEPGKSVGPSLKGILSGPRPMPEAVARGFIQKGSTKMPGYQYSFTAAELDSLIAYLKTQ